MDLIDREQLMNYIRSKKINIGKLAHDVIMKQPNIQKQEPCEDAISRKEVLNQIFYSTDNSGDVVLGSVLRHRIENLPTVKPQEPKIGHWIEVIDEIDNLGNKTWHHKCSICGNEDSGWGSYKYCPNCGAKMESEDKE